MPKKNQGWTLIEIIVVIAIIAIIATAVLVALNPAKRIEQAQDAQRWAEIKSILTAVSSYAADKDQSPTCANLGIDLPRDDIWRCIGSGIVEDPILDPPSGVNVVFSKLRDDCATSCNAGTDGNSCCTSLAEWQTTRKKSLPDNDQIEVLQIEGEWENPDTSAPIGFASHPVEPVSHSPGFLVCASTQGGLFVEGNPSSAVQ